MIHSLKFSGNLFLRCSLVRGSCRHVCRPIPPSHVWTRAPLVRHQRYCSTEPLPTPPSDGVPKVYPEKLRGLVDEISRLTLKEVSQLNELLKSTLNIPDVPVMAAAAGGAPSVSSAASQAAAEEPEEEEQSKFKVKLVSFSSDSKVKLIKEVKVIMEGMNLVQAKKFVEGVPQVVREDLTKEEAQKLKATLEAAGGSVQLE